MKHYTIQEWVDFARGAVDSERKSLMTSHLQTCRACSKEAAAWGRIAAAAKRQENVAIPEGAVHQAKAIFAQYKIEKKAAADAKPRLAKLLFDSMLAPAPLGVRSSSPRPRQLLFEAGDHRIDVRLELEPGTQCVTITGQILDATKAEITQRKIPVSLYVGRRVAGTAETNEFGEFQLGFELPCEVELRAMLPDGQEVSVGLVEPAVPTMEGASYLSDSKREDRNKLREEKKSTRRKI